MITEDVISQIKGDYTGLVKQGDNVELTAVPNNKLYAICAGAINATNYTIINRCIDEIKVRKHKGDVNFTWHSELSITLSTLGGLTKKDLEKGGDITQLLGDLYYNKKMGNW